MVPDFKRILALATATAHAKGTQNLSQAQFDALFLSARAMHALKQKYEDNPLGMRCALMQEDVLALLLHTQGICPGKTILSYNCGIGQKD